MEKNYEGDVNIQDLNVSLLEPGVILEMQNIPQSNLTFPTLAGLNTEVLNVSKFNYIFCFKIYFCFYITLNGFYL